MVRSFLIFILICTTTLLKAQFEAQFSQNVFNQLTINPAYAGSSELVNLSVLSRNQWSGNVGLQTTVFGGDLPINVLGISSGLGLSIYNDKIGFFNNKTFALSYAAKFQLIQGELSLGINIGFLNSTFAGDSLFIPESGFHGTIADDPAITNVKYDGSAFDFGIGAFYKEEKYFLGFSLLHINRPEPKYKDELDFFINRTMYLYGGYIFKVPDKSYVIEPSIFFKTDGIITQTDLSCLVKYKRRYWGGLSYRFQDAIVLIGGLEMKSGVRFGYSYDITTSAIGSLGSSGGTHEITIGYNFDLSFEKRVRQYKSVRYL